MPTLALLDSMIAYRETGAGSPIVLLHGNPTSSYLWRDVMAGLAGQGRLLAPDLIGMGESGKPAIEYRFADHADYLDAWFDGLMLDDVVLVGHDWGGALAFDWARRHPDRVRGVVFLETILKPMTWEEFPSSAREFFEAVRTPGVGEQLVLTDNVFIEQALPGTVATGLSDDDHAVYQAPYPTPESRLPLLQWARSMPLDGHPADVVDRIAAYDRWLADSSEVPKLLLAFDPGPGPMVGPDLVEWCRANVINLDIRSCGPAGHHAPEDQPDAISAAITSWLHATGLGSPAAEHSAAGNGQPGRS